MYFNSGLTLGRLKASQTVTHSTSLIVFNPCSFKGVLRGYDLFFTFSLCAFFLTKFQISESQSNQLTKILLILFEDEYTDSGNKKIIYDWMYRVVVSYDVEGPERGGGKLVGRGLKEAKLFLSSNMNNILNL